MTELFLLLSVSTSGCAWISANAGDVGQSVGYLIMAILSAVFWRAGTQTTIRVRDGLHPGDVVSHRTVLEAMVEMFRSKEARDIYLAALSAGAAGGGAVGLFAYLVGSWLTR